MQYTRLVKQLPINLFDRFPLLILRLSLSLVTSSRLGYPCPIIPFSMLVLRARWEFGGPWGLRGDRHIGRNDGTQGLPGSVIDFDLFCDKMTHLEME
jgi:hypothetical protein